MYLGCHSHSGKPEQTFQAFWEDPNYFQWSLWKANSSVYGFGQLLLKTGTTYGTPLKKCLAK